MPPARTAMATPPPRATIAARQADVSLDEGIRDIRRMDPAFDPARFRGYIEMVFRVTHAARMSRDIASLRDRVTPELHGELQAQCDRSRSLGHASHVGEIEIHAEVTEAWHEDGRDYVTAYIAASTPDDAFLTFTRPAGLNPWMLSAIQTAS